LPPRHEQRLLALGELVTAVVAAGGQGRGGDSGTANQGCAGEEMTP
jgi:hypothetical protein